MVVDVANYHYSVTRGVASGDGLFECPGLTLATITYEKLASIRVPTLLMPGDQDLQAPPWVMRRQLAHIPGAQFIVLPEASHSINWEQPEAFNRNVLEFIRRH